MISSPQSGVVAVPLGGEFQEDETDSMLKGLPRTYQALVRRFSTMSPADSMGEGAYRWADAAFTAGKFDDAGKGYLDFARRYPRNLKVNDALSATLLIKEARDFEDHILRRPLDHELLRSGQVVGLRPGGGESHGGSLPTGR